MLYPRYALLFILLVPVAYFLYRNYRLGRKEFRRVKGAGAVQRLYDAFTVKWVFVSLFYFLSLIFIVLSLLGISSERKNIKEVPEDIDVIFALDISRSMLAEDVVPSRLDRSLNLINHVAGRLSAARFGIVVFKGEGYVLVPVTEDREAVEQAVDIVTPSLFTSGSTSLSAGLETALNAFPQGEDRRKLIICISDGESHAGNAAEIASAAKERDVAIDVLAVGTLEGGRIPIGDDQYLQDKEGSVVVSRMNTAVLKRIAENSGGKYCEIGGMGSLNEVFGCLSINGDQERFEYDEEGRYRPFLLLAVCMLVLSLLVKVIPWYGIY